MATEIRHDFLTETVVALSGARANRPTYFSAAHTDITGGECPFCSENAQLVPTPVYTSPCGLVRVVPNLYPAVEVCEAAYGFHEVIIDTPVHEKVLRDFSLDELVALIAALRSRVLYYRANPRIKYIQIFKNEGRGAGASIPHSHWQLLALDFIPPAAFTVQNNLALYRAATGGGCYLCDIQKCEGTLFVYENERFISYVPYAAAFSYMQNIVPKAHAVCFTEFCAKTDLGFADILKVSLSALNSAHKNASFNLCFFSSSVSAADFHFFAQIIPRIGTLAGFELGAGVHIASVFPEQARGILREYSYCGRGKPLPYKTATVPATSPPPLQTAPPFPPPHRRYCRGGACPAR